jgi:hypothetical protein
MVYLAMRKLLRLFAIAAFLGGFFTPANAQPVGQLNPGQVWGNSGATRAQASPTTFNILSSPHQFYVATSGNGGSDSHDCLAATVSGGHGPCLTIQHAINIVATYGTNGIGPAINVGAGTFVGQAVVRGPIGSGGRQDSWPQFLLISGAGSGSTIIDDNTQNCGTVVASASGANIVVHGFTVKHTGSGSSDCGGGLWAELNGYIIIGNDVNFGEIGAAGGEPILYVEAGGRIETTGTGHAITGDGPGFMRANFQSTIGLGGVTITCSVSLPRMSSSGGFVQAYGGAHVPGAATFVGCGSPNFTGISSYTEDYSTIDPNLTLPGSTGSSLIHAGIDSIPFVTVTNALTAGVINTWSGVAHGEFTITMDNTYYAQINPTANSSVLGFQFNPKDSGGAIVSSYLIASSNGFDLISPSTQISSAGASALAIGLNGVTNPAFNVDASTASQAAGLNVKGAATGGTVAIAAIDSGSNTNLTINAKGSGTINIGNISTGLVTLTGHATLDLPLTGGTLTGAVSTNSQITSTLAIGTAPLVVTSTTLVANLHAALADAAPVGGISGLGTGIATALAVNVGTAGAPVVNGGALGTPSSGVGTNITSVNAATLGGATFAAPGAIGGGTAAAGAFTTITAATFASIGTKVRAAGTAPALTSCGGGSPAIVGSDLAGEVTMGTSATGCIITFNVAYASAPYCTVSWPAQALASQSYTYSTTAITLTQTSTSGNKIIYHCYARAAGWLLKRDLDPAANDNSSAFMDQAA